MSQTLEIPLTLPEQKPEVLKLDDYSETTHFVWTEERSRAALLLAEGRTQQEVADMVGVCRKTIYSWLQVISFAQEVDRLSCMVDISSRAYRLRIAMRVARQKVRDEGVDTRADLLDWLRFAQTETTGLKLGLADLTTEEMDKQLNEAFELAVREEVARRMVGETPQGLLGR